MPSTWHTAGRVDLPQYRGLFLETFPARLPCGRYEGDYESSVELHRIVAGLACMSIRTAAHLSPATLAVPGGSNSGTSRTLSTGEESNSPASRLELTMISTMYVATSGSRFTIGDDNGYDLDDIYADSDLGGDSVDM